MKKFLTLLLLLSFITISAQSIWIADNNPNAPTGSNIFGTIQEAIDAATAGDTIYIQPSNTAYGTGTTEVELHFRGIGFNLDKDIPYQSSVFRLNLYGAPDGSTNASNSTVSGLNITSGLYLGRNSSGDQYYTLNGVRVFNNSVNSFTYSAAVKNDDLLVAYNYIRLCTFNDTVSNTTIRNNVIDEYIIFDNSTTPITATITNNIINGYVRKDAIDDFLVVQNNNFIGNGSFSTAFSSTMENAIISNNIFYGATPSVTGAGASTSTSFENNVFTNNISFSTGNNELPPAGGGAGNTGLGNLEGIDPQFTTATLSTIWQSADDYTTSAAEVTIGGSDGTDIGIFGGPYPFGAGNLTLATSPIPTIQSLNISTIINPGQLLEVEVSAKSN